MSRLHAFVFYLNERKRHDHKHEQSSMGVTPGGAAGSNGGTGVGGSGGTGGGGTGSGSTGSSGFSGPSVLTSAPALPANLVAIISAATTGLITNP
jgi:hypothetical protein